MPSSEGSPLDNNNNPLSFNPFKLLGISPSSSDREVTQQWHKLMLQNHPDKVKGNEDLATRINQAYELIMSADAARRKELEMEYGSGALGGGANPSKIIVDKTLSEEFGRLFRAHVEVAKGTRFRDNFQSFYQNVFDGVETHPKVKSEYCELCDEEFLSELEHEEVVFNPYVDYVMNGAEPDLLTYLGSVFGEETVRQDEIEIEPTTGIWETNVWTTANPAFSQWTEYFKSLRDKGIGFSPAKSTEVKKWVRRLASQNLDTVEGITACVLSHFGVFSCAKELQECDIMLPACLETFADFKDWTGLAIGFASLNEPRFANLFAMVGSSALEPSDHFLKVGDALAEVDLRSAHACYLRSNLDLTSMAKRLITSSSIQAKKFAVNHFVMEENYFLLYNIGKAVAEKDKMKSAIILIPVHLHHFAEGRFDEAINMLGLMLPKNKIWKGIQAMVTMEPELIHSQLVAFHAVEEAEEVLKFCEVLCRTGARFGDQLKQPLEAIRGALHVLASSDNLELYSKAKEKLDLWLPALLETGLRHNHLSLLVTVAKLPGAVSVLKERLTAQGFLGTSPVKTPEPGILFHSALLLLRGIYHSKTENICGMVEDLQRASAFLVGSELITDPIAEFVTGSPLIHERILESTSSQFSQLLDYMDSYFGGDFTPSMFPLLMSTLTPDESTPLAHRFTRKNEEADGRPDLRLLERDVIGRGEEEGTQGADSYSEKGYAYVDLTIIAESVEETILAFGMAAAYFFKAMLATSDSSIPEKFGFHGLILKCMNALKPYSTAVSQPQVILMLVRRLRMSFIFMANHHFSHILQKNNQGHQDKVGLLPVNFLNHDKIPKMTAHWQALVNTKLLCPISTNECQTIQDGFLTMIADMHLYGALFLKRIEKGVFSPHVRDYLYRHMLFHEVWTRRIPAERLECPEANLDSEEGSENKKEDSEEELLSIPIVERGAFHSTRADAMKSLANLHGYGINQVEHMMSWHPIQRTAEGFIDPTNRTLNFGGETAFSRFHGVRINPIKKNYELLLGPADPGDEDRPPLFTMTDINEIFGLGIADANLIFNEMGYSEGLPEFEKIKLPVHPFFQVAYEGLGPDGKPSKERICGTNFLMTLYHLDLLVKMLTTGREVGAKFPFPFKDTEDNLLSGVDTELLRSLMPIGPRKQARLLRKMEVIHRFWFHVDQVEQAMEDASNTNGGKTTFRYGNVSIKLKTMPMIRKDGKVIDAEQLMDTEGPEAKFVQEFNKNIDKIEKLFPIIQRTKELAKISIAFQILHQNKDGIAKVDSSFNQIFGMATSQPRPYSMCGGPTAAPCNCCAWVPAVYAETRVTDEQKLEHLFGNRFTTGMGKDNTVTGEEEKGKLTCPAGGDGNWGLTSDIAKQAGPKNEGKDDPSKSSRNFPQWGLLQSYRVYGGVQFRPLISNTDLLPELGIGMVDSIRMPQMLGRSFQQQSEMGPPPPPPKVEGGESGPKSDKGNKKKKRSDNDAHPNSLHYAGPKWLYEIREIGAPSNEPGKKGIGAEPPVLGEDGKETLPQMQRQLDELNKFTRDKGQPDRYEGTFKILPSSGTRAAKLSD